MTTSIAPGKRADALAPADRHSWLDHPAVAEHYRLRGLIDSLRWEEWVTRELGAPPRRSLQLGCGTGSRSRFLFERRLSDCIDGIDAGEDHVAAAERGRDLAEAPGEFRVADLNTAILPPQTYDLIFACHYLHHVVAIEHLLDQVYASLTPQGMFVIEGFVGPSRFQWSETQIALVKTVTSWLPERLRMFRWAVAKTHEGRPDRAAIVTISPFDAIRSGEIVPLVQQRFHAAVRRPLGGTLQHLLYNGIIHNFDDGNEEDQRQIEQVCQLEDVLIDTALVPSDFMLMIGRRR